MFLSCLLIDLGNNPDRPRPGRLWLRNLYHVHQRLCMAFPSAERISDDANFLKPFKPEDFGNGQVHKKRNATSGFLFRIDPLPKARAVIVVQSAVNPNWDYAFQNAGYLLAARPEVKAFKPDFRQGQRLWFRLVANPTKKIDTIKKEERERFKEDGCEEDLKMKKGRHGRRVPVPVDELFGWLSRRAEGFGFIVDERSVAIQPGYIYMNKSRDNQGQRLRSVRYEGVLEVTNPVDFKETLIRGIGPGKAFGFGLLSVAPIRSLNLSRAK